MNFNILVLFSGCNAISVTMWHVVCFFHSKIASFERISQVERENIMKTTAIIKTKVSNPSVSKTVSSIDTVTLTVIGICASAIGIWSFACIIGGIVAGGGVLGLISGWFKAVTGL